MAYTPDLDWVDDEPPGFDAERMNKMQLGIADASSVADGAASTAAQALQDASSAQATADEALSLVGTGGVHTVDDDVTRIYRAGTTPSDGVQPGDLVISAGPSAQGPAAVPGLLCWLDAAATGARDLSSVLPDVSGNGNDIGWWDVSPSVASVDSLNGLPAFRFDGSSYRRTSDDRPGPRTWSGVVALTGGAPSASKRVIWCSGTTPLDLRVQANGNLSLEAEGSSLYDAPLAWGSGGVAYVSFVISMGDSVRFYLGGQLVAERESPGGGSRRTIVFSHPTDSFSGMWAEFAEHEGHAASPGDVAELAAYYRDKWRV